MFPLLTTTALGIVVVFIVRGAVGVSDGVSFALTMRTVMNLLWPLIAVNLLDEEDRASAALAPSVVWMAVVWWMDSYALVHQRDPTTPRGTRRGGGHGVQLDSHTVTAMSFGLCGLVGARSDTKYVHFILYALLLCIMFVLPHHNLPEDDPMRIKVDEMQRMCLVYSIALLITGIVFTRIHPTRVRSI